MTSNPFELSELMIRRKVLKVLGAAFHVYDPGGAVVGYCKQKAFKLKEDIRLYTDESMGTELLTVRARQIVDFSAAYDVVDTQAGTKVGAARRKGFSSMFRDAWEVMDENDTVLASLKEDSGAMAFLRRFLSNLIPQTFHLKDEQGSVLAVFKQRFNPFVYKLEVSIQPDCYVDRRLVWGAAVLLAAIEGRQD